MSDHPHHEVEPDPAQGTDAPAPPGIPRWVKVSAVVGAILVLLLVAIMLIMGGDHGPGRHQMLDQPSPIERTALETQTLANHASPARVAP